MAYFANRVMNYNGRKYRPGEEIKDFGAGLYDDILLENGMVGSDGEGTGVEDKIANQKARRLATMIDPEKARLEEEQWQSDVDRYQAEKDLVLE